MLNFFRSDITFISFNFRSLCSPYLLNCQYRLVEPSFPTVTQHVFGSTIPWLFSTSYDLIYDI